MTESARVSGVTCSIAKFWSLIDKVKLDYMLHQAETIRRSRNIA